jgi:hypothetical protein
MSKKQLILLLGIGAIILAGVLTFAASRSVGSNSYVIVAISEGGKEDALRQLKERLSGFSVKTSCSGESILIEFESEHMAKSASEKGSFGSPVQLQTVLDAPPADADSFIPC